MAMSAVGQLQTFVATVQFASTSRVGARPDALAF